VYDLKITGGTIVDGTGAPGRVGDVGIVDGRVVALGPAADDAAAEDAAATIDATGKGTAPDEPNRSHVLQIVRIITRAIDRERGAR
jgi:N-acyl-D-aspartate/D-glutamate deacylase